MRKYRQRIHYTEADKNMMWDRWRKGESLESIAQLFDRTHGSVAGILRREDRDSGALLTLRKPKLDAPLDRDVVEIFHVAQGKHVVGSHAQ